MKTEETTQHGGEAALVEQIASLQKQLDDCLETNPRKDRSSTEVQRKIYRFVTWHVEDIISGAMQMDDCSPSAWRALRDELVINEDVSDLFTNEMYRYGLSLVNQIIDKVEIIWRGERENQNDYDFGPINDGDNQKHYYTYTQTIPKIILGIDNHGNIDKLSQCAEAFGLLKEAFDSLPAENFDDFNHAYLKVAMDGILWCQQYLLKSTVSLEG